MSNLHAASAKAALDRFISSPVFIWVMAALTLCANLWGLELPVYTVFVIFAIYMGLWGEDYLGVMPLVIFCYLAPSAANNPAKNETSIFFMKNGGWYLVVLAVALVLSILYRLIRDKGVKDFFLQKRRLLLGLLLVSGAYLLSGIGYEGYETLALRNIIFAGLQMAALLVCYFFFTATVRWDRVRRDYFCHVGLAAGAVVALQVLSIFLSGRAVENGVIHWANITTGWGINNNMGGMLAVFLPFPFYFACKGKWAFQVWAAALYGTICLTCSRNAILFGGICYAICLVYTICTGSHRWLFTLIYTVAIATVLFLLKDLLIPLFQEFFERGLSPSNRDNIYWEGLMQYLEFPVFGGSFFPVDFRPDKYSQLETLSGFFPPLWHNTFVQLGACCGTVGLVAYGFHRVQTLRLMVRNRSREILFVSLSVLALLAVSLLDCHLFNVGPTLFYSMALAVIEKMPGE